MGTSHDASYRLLGRFHGPPLNRSLVPKGITCESSVSLLLSIEILIGRISSCGGSRRIGAQASENQRCVLRRIVCMFLQQRTLSTQLDYATEAISSNGIGHMSAVETDKMSDAGCDMTDVCC